MAVSDLYPASVGTPRNFQQRMRPAGDSDFKVLVSGLGTRAPAYPLPGAVGHAEAKGLLNSAETRWGIIGGQIPTIEALELETKVLAEGSANDD